LSGEEDWELQLLMALMVPVSRLSLAVVALASKAAMLRLAKRRLAAADHRIQELEREKARLAQETEHAWSVRDTFLDRLSHELRTPLNAMLGWVQLLRLRAEDEPMRSHALDVVERTARTQVQVVDDLLDLRLLITGRMHLTLSRVDLPAVVRGACEALVATAAAKNVSLDFEINDPTLKVRGDAARLQQVIWNLVSNGIKFTPPGGRVIVGLTANGNCAEISVRDTGVGIRPEVLPFVFDRFTQGDSSLTRPFGGLGLGLAIVRHLTELHGGSVDAASAGQGRGASFSVRLPIH
jgi:signal transduction histidine kinase